MLTLTIVVIFWKFRMLLWTLVSKIEWLTKQICETRNHMQKLVEFRILRRQKIHVDQAKKWCHFCRKNDFQSKLKSNPPVLVPFCKENHQVNTFWRQIANHFSGAKPTMNSVQAFQFLSNQITNKCKLKIFQLLSKSMLSKCGKFDFFLEIFKIVS